MRYRAKRLSQVRVEQFTLAGYSVAGEESVIVAPELDCVFDIGKCPREALNVNHVLLSHGHTDHSAGLPYYFAQRDFQGIEGGTALVPAKLVAPLEELMAVWGRIDGNLPPHKLIGMSPGDDYQIRRDLTARAFKTQHRPDSLGYSLIDVRNKLKAEFQDLTGPQIVELKTKGVEITDRVEVPLVTYLGDTGPANYSDLPFVAEAKALLIECTFFDDDHADRARLGRHLHVNDLPGVLEGMRNKRIIITHVTRRTNMSTARKALRSVLDSATLDRVTFLMDLRHVADDDD
jgi:ribonuclease Z